MSAFKLASTMKSSLKEAELLIDEYFNAFPKIKRVLTQLANFGLKNGYIQTLKPFNRKRWFPFWKYAKHLVDIHIRGIEYNDTLGSIERQSKNAPIQGSAADQMKLAMVFVYWYIYDNKLQDDIHLVAQVHDQLTTTTRTKEIADWWAKELDFLMCEAAKVVMPTGILKAETQVTPYWTK